MPIDLSSRYGNDNGPVGAWKASWSVKSQERGEQVQVLLYDRILESRRPFTEVYIS